jgi:hypothetical protein
MDVSNQEEFEDGPLFRATIEQLESKTSHLKQSIKKCLKSATAYLEAKRTAQKASDEFILSLSTIPSLDKELVQYCRETEDLIQAAHEKTLCQMESLLVEPLEQIYELKIKAFENSKKEFDHLSSVRAMDVYLVNSQLSHKNNEGLLCVPTKISRQIGRKGQEEDRYRRKVPQSSKDF